MTASCFYLMPRPSWAPRDSFMLVVERVDDHRGYRLLCSDRHHARRELGHLRALVASIGPRTPAQVFDPVEVDGPA